LTAQIPYGEGEVLICDGFDIEAYCGDGGDDLADFEAVEEGGFAGAIETKDKDAAKCLVSALAPQ
jgi:hypothetical protein